MASPFTSPLKKVSKVIAGEAELKSLGRIKPCSELPSVLTTGSVHHVYCDCGNPEHQPQFPSRYRAPSHAVGEVLGGNRISGDLFDGWGHDESRRSDWPFIDDERLDPEIWDSEESEEFEEYVPEYEGPVIHDPQASYGNMASPGRISFYMDRVFMAFWRHVQSLRIQHRFLLARGSVAKLSELNLYSIWYHELFHHFCDVQTYLSGQSGPGWRRRKYEEPLAVAYSRHMVGAKYRAENFVTAFLELRYDYSSLQYYRNWNRYLSGKSFQEGLASYIPRPQLGTLQAKGFDAGGYLFDSVPLVTDQEHFGVVFWWPRSQACR